MPGENLSPDQAYDVLIVWAQSLVNKARRRSKSIHDIAEMKADVLTEVVGAVDMVEAMVRRSMEPDDRCECERNG